MDRYLNPYSKSNFSIINDNNDFKMPYKIYGKLDKEIMLDRYSKLSNQSKHYLHVRYR